MQQLLKSLPSLNGLRVFEVAARLGSFKMAAQELCITQAAISRQIRQLEDSMGVELFLRSHRRVDLTEAGRKLFVTTNRALTEVATVSRDIRQGSQLECLNLYATSSFTRLWLVPRLQQLRQLHPQIHLHLISVEDIPATSERFDAAITLGLEDDATYQSDYLFSEQVFPVCTPEFMAAHPEVGQLDALVEQPLLELDSQFWKARWWSPIDWPFWLREQGAGAKVITPPMSFSHFPMLLDAVLQGVGVGLGWRHLVQDMLDDGRLICPVQESYAAPERKHYFVCRKDLAEQPEMLLFRAWLLEQTAAFRHH